MADQQDPTSESLDDGTIPVGPAHVVQRKQCEVCLAPMAPESLLCSRCGYDERVGPRTSTLYKRVTSENPEAASHKAARTCRECGYDLSGNTTSICPECGTPFGLASARNWSRPEAERSPLRAHALPISLFLIGVVGVTAIYVLSGQHALVPLYFMRFLARAPILFAAYLLCAALWAGMDDPLDTTAIRFVSIIPVIDLVALVAGAALAGVVGLTMMNLVMLHRLVQALVFVGLLYKVMDLDIEDAAIVGLLLTLVHVGSSLLILYQPGLL